ncbi:BMP family ABC transporter substrate-binding protein [Brevibacterium sp. BDJS002]|uniref:BMP family ABC transporter substrate-binding protein n=2 Tax=Brevibacterium aurantiacum TaxID=273384 RepID=A0A2A3YS92_BREAU|nr:MULTISPECIES: BMP family ABC transporter substrate-binding protein [Brevibacterium]AZL06499.1 BMP family ABC transporter substrate-binding protein [Brevibacterium aurantiacum]AZT94235.1 BMP family ABC transporter substrate-binding protein [Brevibacterium aurantiacum]MDN5739044.1 BMP family ABC transporter substrate-binding protein [Brevibacterium aurantiacum]MDN5793859.1 BMP family ABC transporter substrate-binding protein [Brevibacterium aurantiacum]PCC42148.1 BMP family ABC transporter su
MSTVLGAGFSALSLVALSACSMSTPEPVEEETLGCMISAPAGFDDHSAGALTLAETELARSAGLFSATSSQRVTNSSATSAALTRMKDQDCALTTVLGPGGADELSDHAKSNPDDVFLGVASGHEDFPDNVLSIDFDLVPPAFIAGYIAATASETGEVGALVSQGFPQAKKILNAFDAGVALYNDEADEDVENVKSYRESAVDDRTVADTSDEGRKFFESAYGSDVDVLVPFGSAAAMGVATASTEEMAAQRTQEPKEEGAEEKALPKVIWYGASGAFSDTIIATIEPNIRRGLRSMFAEWPQSRNPDEVAEASKDEPADMGGFLITDKHYKGTIDNGGVGISAEDGFLSRVSDAGRSITDLRERIKSGDIDPEKS